MNTTFDTKDTARILSMAQKAGGNSAKFERLARNMAAAITKADKALRRCRAAEDENFHSVAAIFMDRYRALSGTGLGAAESDTAEPKSNRDLAFESQQAPAADLQIVIKNAAFREKEKASAKPRIYFWDETASDLSSLFMQRYTPQQVFQPHVDTVLRPLGMTTANGASGPRRLQVRVRWSQFAGCRMCPCSPGFVVDNPDYEYDIHVHYEIVKQAATRRRA